MKSGFTYLLLIVLLLFPAVTLRAQGIDVSQFQGTINWKKVSKSSKAKFVYIRATEGASRRDKKYAANVKGARAAGIKVGSYHVYSSKTTAYQQFANFKSVVVKKHQDLIPVLDIEGHHSGKLNMERVEKLLELMQKEYGVRPMIYTSETVYKLHFAGKEYAKYHIFIAKYEGNPSVRYTLWQYSEEGSVSGISGNVDLSKFGSKHSLKDIQLPKPKKKKAVAKTPSAKADAKPAAKPASKPVAKSSTSR